MDEDDSQDELINCSTSQNKGKRAALWAISDDSDDVEEESGEGESDSGEDEEEGHLDGEEDDEDEEEGNEEDDDEEDEEEEEDGKAVEGATGGTSADLADMSSDEEAEKCPICLNSFTSQPVATPENCVHYFCLDCILEWAKNANLCPIDRINFNNIHLRKCYGGKVQKVITVQKPAKQQQQEVVDLDLEQTSCEVCGGSDREDRLLLCDGCDAGYHMECLTPPLDAVPVEEWFCPECEANNRRSRGSAEDLSDTESLPSTARPTSSRSQSRFAGPTRAIARTQHSERVRANVNRSRITQARTSQLAPTYLIQSTWLDETINAVVAGLNTAVYVRDFTPRVPTRRRRQTGKRRKVKGKKTSSAKGKKGKAASTGVKRRKRKMRRTKSKKKLMAKKAVTPRSRIANNLGIVKDKKSSSLPTVYRPSEHTLSSMRADIGAASLSIYGDPFDLDPFVDREEEEQQTHVSSLLQAKRRGISHSAFRSHQPVARPVTASLSRRGVDVPQSGGVVEAAPVPDLLGSILSGQSMLLMDSSDVVINRDGSLKATKPMSLSSSVKPSCSSSSGDINTCVNPVMSPNHVDISSSLQGNRNLPGTSESSLERHFSQSSSRFPPLTPSTTSHREPGPHSSLPPRGHPGLQAPHPRGPTLATGHQGINRARDHRETISSSHLTSDSSSKSKGPAPSQSQPKKAPTKPMWVDVSVLPRIPKIKRESSVSADDATSQVGSSGNDNRSSRASSSSSTTSINSYGMRETGINSLAGDKGRQHSVDQQQGRTDGQAQRHRADGAGSSSSFSNSFSSSSSSTGSHSSQPCCSSLSSSSSSVSFRISSSGNSWHSRRLSITSSTTSGGNVQERRKQKEDEARKRQLHRDKQMLLASRTVSKEETNTIYDPFNPTVSDSSTSDDEGESTSWESSSRLTTLEGRSPSLGNKEYLVQNDQDSVQVKTEKEESPVSQGELGTAAEETEAQETVSWELGFPKEDIKVEQETTLVDTNIGTESALLKNTVKKEPDDADKAESCSHSLKKHLDSDTEQATQLVHHHRPDLLKTEKDIKQEESEHNTGTPNTVSSNSWKTPPGSSSTSTEKKQRTDTKSESHSKSPSRDTGNIKKTSKKHVSSKEQRARSSSSEADRCRREDRTAGRTTQGGSQKGKDKDRVKSSRRSRSKERRRVHTGSDSSRSNSPDRSSRKRRRSRSRSKNRRRSRSGSSSSSREHSRGRKHKRRSKERYDGRERDHERRRATKDKRHDRSRSRSRSRDNRHDRSRSRSRSRDNRRGRSRSKSRSRDNRRDRSRSRSRSRDNRRGRSRSRSRDNRRGRSRSKSQSRERRKDHVTQPSSTLSSRDRVESRPREQRRGRSRSSSREKKKEDGSSKSSQKTPGSGSSSLKDTKVSKDKKKDKDCPVKEEKVTKTSKREVPPSTSVSKVKKEASDFKADEQVTKTEMVIKEKDVKEIKKEKPPLFDMFEDSPINTPVKKEEVYTPVSSVPECIKEEETQKEVEACEMKTVKSEPSSPDRCQINPGPSLSVVTTNSPPSVCTPLTASPLLTDSTEQPNTDVLTVKQEPQQPSDSDEDFNVDVMLDNLDFVKSEPPEGKGASVKQEKEVEEVKNEGEQVVAAVGVKSKTQVKRVTWNIQEPEGPQPEKSASKVALYKLKLKQEGVRRPSSGVPTSTQDISGAVSVSDSSKKAGAGPHIFSSRSDSSHPEELLTTGQGAAEEDLSRKDQYLKKLHMQERAIEEVKLAIKPFYQRRDINKDEYKEILRKAVQKVCHSKSGEINPVKVGNLVKAYVDKYKHARKHRKGEDSGRSEGSEAMKTSDSP